jgi:sugar phosphate permease
MSIEVRVARRIHYGWIVAATTFAVLLVGAGMRSAPGVLLVPLEEAFGWSRATISFAVSVNLLMYGLTGPFAAALLERIGIRASMLIALTTISAGFALTTLMTAPWQLVLLWGIVVGGGAGMIATVLGAIVANRWFKQQRGLVIGTLTASAAAGQLIFLPYLAHLVEYFGWRIAVLGAVAASVLLIPFVAALMREHPQDVGLVPYGDTGNPPRPIASRANPFVTAFGALGRAAGTRDFWLIGATFFVCGASTNGLIGTHLIASCLDHGIPEVAAASVLALMGLFNFAGTTASGWLSDRIDNRYLLFCYYATRGASLLFLPYSYDYSVTGLTIFGVFYGLDWIATVPPTVRLTTNCFGVKEAGMVFGWIMVGHQVGSAAAAFGAGLVRTLTGDYVGAFATAGVLCLLAAMASLRIGIATGRTGKRREVAPAAAGA